MYESWYLNHFDQHNDLFHKDFDIFGLQNGGSGTRLSQLEGLNGANVLDWVKDYEHMPVSAGHGSLRLLLTRHKRHQQHEIKPWYIAFEKETFRAISSTWKLPADYLYLRKNAAGCGAYRKHTTFNDQGSVSHLGFTIRVPHSPRNTSKAIWSMTTSWDASTSNTNALFEAVSDADIQEVRQYVEAHHSLTSHPLLLPTMLLELLNTFFIDHRRAAERALYLLERQLGITRGKDRTDVWDWNYEVHRDNTKSCNGCYTTLVYLERRLEFVVGLSQFLLESLASMEEEGLLSGQQGLTLSRSSKMIKETVQNHNSFAQTALHQILCLQKRCQSLMTVLYTVITQQDSKINVKIAKAAKQDSSSMTAIAILGFTFLPAMLVASMFSMSMFDFSIDSSGRKHSIVTSNFWMYWVVTIPLTLVVLTLWKLWMSFHRETSANNSEWQERTTAMKSMHEANLGLNTPFIP